MRYRGDLGVPGVTAALFLFVPVLVLLLRRKWMLAAARRDEIERLLLLAKEEAERAEMESVFPYRFESTVADAVGGVVGGSGGGESMVKQCAVCYSPTTTRCSRCKAVRYCSGKCQIIHWRQGHKDECRPAVDSSDASGCYSDMKPANTVDDVTNVSCSRPNKSTPDGLGPFDASFSTFGKDGEIVLADGVKTECGSTFVSPVGTSEATNRFTSTGNIYETECAKSSPSLVVPLGSPFNNISFSSESVQEIAASCARDSCRRSLSSRSVDSNDSAAFVTVANPALDDHEDANLSFMKSGDSSHCKLSKKTITAKRDGKASSHLSYNLSDKDIPARTTSGNEVCVGRSVCGTAVAASKGKEALLCRLDAADEASLKSKGLTPPQPDCVSTRRSSNGANIVPNPASSVKSPSPHIEVSRNTNDTSNSDHALKSSVRCFVQQLKPSKLSKPSEMLSPYDFFMKLYHEKVELQPCGLINCGNSCYANAVLQCLAFTKPLTAYLLRGLHSKSCSKKDWCFACELENLVLKIRQGRSPLSPIGILSHIHNIGRNLGHGKEEDAHEFLRYAIDAMQSACVKESGKFSKGLPAEETTLVQLIFGGYLRSKIKCMRCQGTSVRCEKMMDLTVEIHGDIKTLKEALARFTATEVLDGENKYQCNRCKSYEKAKKKLEILEAPNVLTIALKRFQSGKFGKLNKPVEFPEFLNMSEYMCSRAHDSNPEYCLYAVVVHLDVMNAAFSGHYVCYVKNTQGKWYKIDDSVVKPVEADRVLSKGAYMLLYARVSPREPSFIRSLMACESGRSKNKIWPEALSYGNRGGNVFFNSRSDSTIRRINPYDPDRGNLTSDDRARNVDSSSSDSSSLLSCSDEGSCSTESSRDSTSTDGYRDYLFGDSGRYSWDSPSFRNGEDMDGSISYSPISSRTSSDLPSSSNSMSDLSCLSEEDACQMRDLSCEDRVLGLSRIGTRSHRENREIFPQGRESSQFLPPDANITHCRKFTEQNSSRKTDRSNSGRVRSSLLTRMTTRDPVTRTDCQ